jgi:hypothetical protein
LNDITNDPKFHDKFVNKLKWIDEQIVSIYQRRD